MTPDTVLILISARASSDMYHTRFLVDPVIAAEFQVHETLTTQQSKKKDTNSRFWTYEIIFEGRESKKTVPSAAKVGQYSTAVDH